MIYVDNFMNCGLGWVGMFLGLMVVLNRGYIEFFFDNSDICWLGRVGMEYGFMVVLKDLRIVSFKGIK